MTSNKNFMWVEEDIRNTLVLKVMYKTGDKHEIYGVFDVLDVLETTGEQLDIQTANIDDLSKLMSFGMVRFVNVIDASDIIDIPLRNIYMLYKNGNMLGEDNTKTISFSELDAFSIIDGTIRNDLIVLSALIDKPSEDLDKLMKISSEYLGYGMQEKFDALTDITMINHRRLLSDRKEKGLI